MIVANGWGFIERAVVPLDLISGQQFEIGFGGEHKNAARAADHQDLYVGRCRRGVAVLRHLTLPEKE